MYPCPEFSEPIGSLINHQSPINSFGLDLSEFCEPIGSLNSDRSGPKLLIGDLAQ